MESSMDSSNPDVSVIVAVYNNFHWLRLVLDSMQMQSYKNFEVVVADDGSSEETVERLKAYISANPHLRIVHSRQEDEGWRKNKCLNKAVRNSGGEYLVFIDGDCIPHPRFVEDHVRLRRRGVVTGGRRIESGEALSRMIEGYERLPHDFFSRIRKFIIGRIGKENPGKVMSQLRRSLRFPYVGGKPLGLRNQGILGANFGIYRSDLERVNGFDERYLAPGTGEDTDLDERLANAGIRHVKASHYALMVHRHHARLPMDSEENRELLRAVRENGISYVETGLNQGSEPEALAPGQTETRE